ncbi:MAG: MoxR family ATPase [Vicinamibacterales bacterium]
MSSSPQEWKRYRGDGASPGGDAARTRGEAGRYLADEDLVTAVNAALAVQRPLLVTGEPGCGKTMLAWSVAAELGLGEVLAFHTRSDHQARDVLYSIDHLQRFYHAQIGDQRAADPASYVRWQALGEAIKSAGERVVLIDEVDKAPRDFPNDLLDEIDRMEFTVPEFGWHFKAEDGARPIVIITSNSERQLPDPFLRRCVYHYIPFPAKARLQQIVTERLGTAGAPEALVRVALDRFYALREVPGMEKKPATAELLMWVRVLTRAGVDAATLERAPLGDLPLKSTMVKTEHDRRLLERQ